MTDMKIVALGILFLFLGWRTDYRSNWFTWYSCHSRGHGIPFGGHADYFSAIGHRLHNMGGHPTKISTPRGPPARPKPIWEALKGSDFGGVPPPCYGGGDLWQKIVRMAIKWDSMDDQYRKQAPIESVIVRPAS